MRKTIDLSQTGMLKRILDRMHDLGISQAEVARRGGFNRAFISDLITTRKSGIRSSNVKRLAHALYLEVDYLMFGTGPVGPDAQKIFFGLIKQRERSDNPVTQLSDAELIRWLQRPPAHATNESELAFLKQSGKVVGVLASDYWRLLDLATEASNRLSEPTPKDEPPDPEDGAPSLAGP